MTDIVAGYLEVGINESGEVVINHPDLKPDADGVGHIVFSPRQARNLGELLIRKAKEAAREGRIQERHREPSASLLPRSGESS